MLFIYSDDPSHRVLTFVELDKCNKPFSTPEMSELFLAVQTFAMPQRFDFNICVFFAGFGWQFGGHCSTLFCHQSKYEGSSLCVAVIIQTS